MNCESEALQRSFLRLLQELIPNASPADAEAIRQGLESENAGVPHSNMAFSTSIAPQDNQPGATESTVSISASRDSEAFSVPRKSSREFGDIPVVQDRFHTLLKRRLSTEIQLNPPLFPWETELYDYETSDLSAVSGAALVSEPSFAAANLRVPVGLWLSQLKAFNLPVAIPDAVLLQLFQRCQDAARSSRREGAKLVHAVEALFPDRDQVLNYLAGLVMTAPARSPVTVAADASQPQSYEAAEPAQQMVLSLLAAREILNALTLTISPCQVMERQWLTELGALTLRVHYQPSEPASLRVEGTLPTGGELMLRGGEAQAIAQRLNAGALSVELLETDVRTTYELEVQFTEQAEMPLVFAIQIA